MHSTSRETLSRVVSALLFMCLLLFCSIAFAGETIRVSTSASSGADASINQNQPAANYNTGTLTVRSTTAGTPNSNYRSVFSFDLTGLAGSAVKVSKVGLFLSSAPTQSRTLNLRRLTEPWVEDQVSWSNRSTSPTAIWTNAGGTFSTTNASTFSTGTSSGVTLTSGTIRNDNTTNFVQTWVDNPATNLGFILYDRAENSNNDRTSLFSSRTGANPPYMDVTVLRNVAVGAPSALSPSAINLGWSFPQGSTSANYDGVTISIAPGSTAPAGVPTDGTVYSVGQTLGTGSVVANTNAFNILSSSIENGDRVVILPGTQYTLSVYTHDSVMISGAASVNPPHYSPGVSSSTVTTPTASGNLVWTYATGAASLASPTPSGSGTVVTGGNDNLLHAMDENTGARKFIPVSGGAGDTVRAVQDRVTIIPAAYTQNPTCRNVCDVVYVSTGNGTLKAYRADTGARLWTSGTLTSGGGSLVGSPAVQLYDFSDAAFQGTHAVYDLIIVGTNNQGSATNNRVFGINGNTGATVFNYNQAQTIAPGIDKFLSAPYVDYASNSVWLTSYSNGGAQPSVHHISTLLSGSVNTAQPRILLSTSSKDVAGAPTLDFASTYLFVLTNGGDIVAIDTATNTEVASVNVGGTGVGYPMLDGNISANIAGVVVSTSTGVHKRLFDRTARTFSPGWDATGIPNPSVPVYSAYPDQLYLYVGSSDGNLYKVSNADGSYTNLPVNPGVTLGSPAYDEMTSKIYVGDTSGHIYALNVF